MHDTIMQREVRKKIAFVMIGYGLGNSPSLINAAKMFASHGYDVDFFTCCTFLGNVQFDDSRINIHNIPDPDSRSGNSGFFSKVKRAVYYRIKLLSRKLPWEIRLNNEKKSIYKSIVSFVESVKSIINTTKYSCYIGVEPLGMMAAYHLSSQTDTPFVYYNMELHIDCDKQILSDFVVKKIEKKLNRFASFTITQDAERGRLIADENGIQEHSILTVPVCAEGEPFKEKTSYLHDMFGLPADTRIVLYAGFIADWAMCLEIAESAQLWPENWVMVFHTHGYNNEDYINKIRRFESRNVRFSMSPVPYEELSAFLASADIGIALYKDLGVNFTLISSASGKLAHYLKSGLPVVVNSYPGISRLVDKYSCGIGIDSPDQLYDAICKIFENYQHMQSGAYRCYEENYRFSRHFTKVIDRIDQL